jgi:hypothetical protein
VSPREVEQKKHFDLSVVLEEEGQSSTQSNVNFNECYKDLSRNKVVPGTSTQEREVPKQLTVIFENDTMSRQQSTTTISHQFEKPFLSCATASHRSVSQLPMVFVPMSDSQSKEALDDYLYNCNLVDQEHHSFV